MLKAVRQKLEERARKVASSIQCSVHGRAVRDCRVEMDRFGKGRGTLTPCCEAMNDAINEAIRGMSEAA